MAAEERYPECGGRVDGRLTSRRMRAMPAPAARRGHSFAFANGYKCVWAASPGAYAPNGRQKWRK